MSKKPDDWATACKWMLGSSLQTPEFRSAWLEWAEHRREKRATLTPKTVKLQIRRCEDWGQAKAIRSMERSIFKGWIGLFEAPDEPVKHTVQPGSPAVDAADERRRAKVWWNALTSYQRAQYDSAMISFLQKEHPRDWQSYVDGWKEDGEWVRHVRMNRGRLRYSGL